MYAPSNWSGNVFSNGTRTRRAPRSMTNVSPSYQTRSANRVSNGATGAKDASTGHIRAYVACERAAIDQNRYRNRWE